MSAIVTQPLGNYVSVLKEDGSYKTFQFSEGDILTGVKCAKWPAAVLTGKVIGVGVVRNNITQRNDTAWGEGRAVDPCPVIVSATDAITPTTITIESDVECVCGCTIKKGEIITFPITDIVDITSVTCMTKIVTPDDDLAAVVTAATEGQIIRLLPGEYEKDITATVGVKIIGSGTHCTKISGTITVTAGGKYVQIEDVAIEDAAAKNTALVSVTDKSKLLINHCTLSLTDASGITGCSLISRPAVAAGVVSEISVRDSVLQVIGGDPTDDNAGIVVGGLTASDMGDIDLNLNNTQVIVNGIAVCCATHGRADVTCHKSKLIGLSPITVAHSGESTTSGVFETNFSGSELKVLGSKITAVQPNQASGSTPDTNENAAVSIQTCKLLSADISETDITVCNTTTTNKNAAFAPMRVIDINETTACESCEVKLRAVRISVQEPSAGLFRCDGKTNYIDIDGSVSAFGTGPNGEIANIPVRV